MSNTKRRADARKATEQRNNFIFIAVVLLAVVSIGFGVFTSSSNTAASDSSLTELYASAQLEDCPTASETVEPVAGGLPDQELPCLGTEQTMNFSQLRGKPLIVNVWGSWCPPCVEELPWLAEFHTAAAGSVQVLGVNVGDEATPALEMLIATGVHFPSVFDPSNTTRATLQWNGTPITLFVSPAGEILYRHEGRLPDGDALYLMANEIFGLAIEDPTL